jgi:hypothetical protein
LVAVALLAGTMYGYAQEPEVVTDGNAEHARFSDFDTTAVWHPKRILIVWPEMQLDILLPRDSKRSGVANLLLRDRRTGDVCLLDSVKNNSTYGEIISNDLRYNPYSGELEQTYYLDCIKHTRYANRFEPGLYDAIVLYNNGKYITVENISFENGMKKVVDMTKLRPHKADDNSREWLKLRKFTDIVGQRTLGKNYRGTSPHKIIGYLFVGRQDFEPDRMRSASLCLYMNKHIIDRTSGISFDGFFEMDVDYGYETYLMTWRDLDVKTQANTWIFAVHKYKDLDEM